MSKDESLTDLEPVKRVTTVDAAFDKYDHEIRLIDSASLSPEDRDKTATIDTSSGRRHLLRRPTQISVREELARRKYAKWRQDRVEQEDDDSPSIDASQAVGTPGTSADRVNATIEPHPEDSRVQAADFAAQPSVKTTSRPKHKHRPKHKSEASQKDKNFAIDILYENQRGTHLCGIPLYSHSSLLNFDPSAWVTSEFHTSPVDITNAQPPDPSWTWSWKTWYVDMSDDVDEEGWQYSFNFGPSFSWHGTHPWFTSFVRRRRWLRKRVKKEMAYSKQTDALEAAHHLNADYFTIHSKKRDRSPGSITNPDTKLQRPASYMSQRSVGDETKKMEDIRNIPLLMDAIRASTIDRQKLDAVKEFVEKGGEELYYLPERISEIMASFVFQNAKRQLLESLRSSADEARKQVDQDDASEKIENEPTTQRAENLRKAAQTASEQIEGLEYWSNHRYLSQNEGEHCQDRTPTLGGHDDTRHSNFEIKGISERAETTHELRVNRRLTQKTTPSLKGKEPETEYSPRTMHSQNSRVPIDDEFPSLGRDDILVPEDDNGDDSEVVKS